LNGPNGIAAVVKQGLVSQQEAEQLFRSAMDSIVSVAQAGSN
jgi:hypothetical protein